MKATDIALMDSKIPAYFNNISPEDRAMLKNIAGWIDVSQEKFINRFSFFLDERQCELSESYLKSICFENYLFFGGYDGSRRKVLGVFPQYSEISESDFPIKPVYFTFRKADVLSHRDFLGAIMAQMVRRDAVGDIAVCEGCAEVYLYNTVCDSIAGSISKIGSCGVNVSFEKNFCIEYDSKYSEINGTVASMRVDCIISMALGQSREKASRLIESGLVMVDYVCVNNSDYNLKRGAVFSIRGFGKFELGSINGHTKKDRLHITIKKYF